MNIAYTIWIEWLDSPILKSQVIELLKAAKKISPNDHFFLFAFQPIYTTIFRRKKLREINKNLKNSNIRLIIIPSLMPPIINLFNVKWYMLPIIFLQTFPTILTLVIINKIDILHCRSYPIMLATIAIKKVMKKSKVVFDPRSPFPEESIIGGRWTEKSISHKVWKILERIFLDHSDVTIAITDTYVKHFKKMSSSANFETVPNNVDTTKFSFDQNHRSALRSRMGIKDNEIIFVYLGSLGKHWNNPIVYAKFLIHLRELDINHRFLFITPNILELNKVFNKYNIGTHEYCAVFANPSDVPKYLSMADVGLNFMAKQDIRMSIKTCEYLAMGLPVIVNSNVMGAKEIIEQYHVGLVLEDLSNINLEDIKEIVLKKMQLSVKCRKVAYENFSTTEIAKRYVKIYKLLDQEDQT